MADHRDSTDEPHPHLVIGAWAAALVEGRRVALLGDATTGLAEQLAGASGRRVHAYDPDPARLAAAIAAGGGGDVAFASVEEAFDARAAAFDAVVVPDLTAFDDASALLSGAATMLSGRGLLVLASPHESVGGGALGYYDLYDAVTAELDEVHMFGVAPFVGYTIADFAAEGEPAVTVDTALADAEEPLQYLVVATRARASLDPYTLLQVPTDAGLAWLGGSAEETTHDAARAAQAAADADALRAALKKAEDDALRATKEARDREGRTTQLSSRLAEVQTELERTRDRLAQRAHSAEERAEKLQRELRASRSEYGRARAALEEAHQEDLDRMLDRIAELEAEAEEAQTKRVTEASPPRANEVDARAQVGQLRFQMDELMKALDEARRERDAAREESKRLEARLRAVETEAKRAPQAREELAREVEHDLARDLSRLEDRLKERGRIVAELTAQVRQAERVGRELVRELERARGSRSDGSELIALEAELDTLRQTCTRQQADLEATRWRLTQLESAEEGEPADDVTKLEAALAASREELAKLRRTLDARGEEDAAS